MGRYLTGLILALAAVAAAAAAAENAPVSDAIHLALQQRPPLSMEEASNPALPETALRHFYLERDNQPAWLTAKGLHPGADILTARLAAAAEEGLCSEAYRLPEIEELAQDADDTRRHRLLDAPRRLARLDLLLSEAFFTYAAHLIHGRVDPVAVHGSWHPELREVDLAKLLDYALAGGRMAAILDDLVPPHPGYRRLRLALASFRRIAALGGWETLPEGALIHPGEDDPRVPALRLRLAKSGDLPPELVDMESRYDPATARALRTFQRRHGLPADGVLGPLTLGELNRPVEERIRQLEVNLERWRWLPKTLGERYLQVNIADLTLSAVENGHSILSMPVVVGNAYRQTPVFSARLQYLIFAPYWYVPPTIFRVDKLPLLRRDPGYLEKHQFDLVAADGSESLIPPGEINWKKVRPASFQGVLRQAPGPWNPLGRVKFIFPNPFAVYLHDTPERHLFAEDVRTFSSGCIRVERPLDLAQLLLQNQREGGCEFLLDAMESSAPRQVNLARPWPIHLLYFTAWVDEGGEVNFRPDLYWRDLVLEEALSAVIAPQTEPVSRPDEETPQRPTFFQVRR